MIVSEDEFDCLNLIYLKKSTRDPSSCILQWKFPAVRDRGSSSRS
jgi:hypothetical protein